MGTLDMGWDRQELLRIIEALEGVVLRGHEEGCSKIRQMQYGGYDSAECTCAYVGAVGAVRVLRQLVTAT